MEFGELLPDLIFDTVTAQGFRPTGALMPLNSYENRVYEIPVEGAEPLVGKYYRPGRHRPEAIAEEHRFLAALAEAEIPVVLPLPLPKPEPQGSSLGKIEGLYYTFFPKFRGREHAEITHEDLRWLGRTLSRMHNLGEHFTARHRMPLNPQTYGYASLDFILSQPFLPPDLLQNLEVHLRRALELLTRFFPPKLQAIPLHGDCHPGNILWNQAGPHLLDFDDMVIAPPVQDIWMLFSGSEAEQREQREKFFEGYEIFREFDDSTLILAEPLRTLRMIRHAAWIGQRYEEPIFQRAFPYYRERRYWEQFLLSIKEQISLLQELN
jgi:Ser/Thr protein kinase RdoA (MazF antagonist)